MERRIPIRRSMPDPYPSHLAQPGSRRQPLPADQIRKANPSPPTLFQALAPPLFRRLTGCDAEITCVVNLLT